MPTTIRIQLFARVQARFGILRQQRLEEQAARAMSDDPMGRTTRRDLHRLQQRKSMQGNLAPPKKPTPNTDPQSNAQLLK